MIILVVALGVAGQQRGTLGQLRKEYCKYGT